ncbi:MAG TPA: serine hydrolase domain-containing protein [Caulobacteraceae bacterium]|jgi:CubicO group peptidase (beta-lactamase class C family)|nr:serine hydrolase domain-containing protein [Caulobacteraceae bacterium]
MALTRRGWFGAAAVAALAGAPRAASAQAPRPLGDGPSTTPPGPPAPPFRISAPGAGTHDYTEALERLRAYALSELRELGLPGMTLAVTDADGFTACLPLGWADVERPSPVREGTYFQIGSISKSFVALTVLALADRGKLDIDAPLARYLPQVPLPHEPITLAQLLSHTSGLPDGAPAFPRTPDGRLWCGFAPGSSFSYSNVGFMLLGRVIEAVTGQPFQMAVDEMVRRPLGLTGILGVIREQERARYAVGYWPWDPFLAGELPHSALGIAYWTPEDTPAGSVGARATDMAIYLRALMRLARGQGAPVLSDAAARRFVRPVIDSAADFGPGSRYAMGIDIAPVDGIDCLHHTGGMMAFSSSFHADAAAGVAAFASVNARLGGYRPRRTTAYAIRLMRAVRAGARLPDPPDALQGQWLDDGAQYTGRFVASDQRSFEIEGSGPSARLTSDEVSGRLSPRGPDRLVTDHPKFDRYGFDAVRQGGRITGFWWGESLFSRDVAAAPTVRSSTLAPLAGVYLNRDPWIGGAELLVRGDRLVLEGAGPLAFQDGYWTTAREKPGVERMRFDAPLNGRMTRLNVSGWDLLRLAV